MGDEHSGSEGHRDEQSGLKQHEGCGVMSDPTQNNTEGARDEPLGSKPQRGPEVSNWAWNAMVGVRDELLGLKQYERVGMRAIWGETTRRGRDMSRWARNHKVGQKRAMLGWGASGHAPENTIKVEDER